METTVIQTVTEAAEKAGTTIMISTILKFGGFCIAIMAVIYLLAVLTPKIAARLDKFMEKHKPKRVNDRTDEVRGIYDMPPKKENNENNKEDEVK